MDRWTCAGAHRPSAKRSAVRSGRDREIFTRGSISRWPSIPTMPAYPSDSGWTRRAGWISSLKELSPISAVTGPVTLSSPLDPSNFFVSFPSAEYDGQRVPETLCDSRYDGRTSPSAGRFSHSYDSALFWSVAGPFSCTATFIPRDGQTITLSVRDILRRCWWRWWSLRNFNPFRWWRVK